EPARRVIFPQTERRAPPGSPPPPPPLVTPVDEKVGVDRVLLDALGKRAWQAEKLHEQEDRFFNTHTLTFEGPELLPFRKELWEWCVKCVKGEKGDLFLAHVLEETDKWDLAHLVSNLSHFLNTENFLEFGRKLENFFAAKPRERETIF